MRLQSTSSPLLTETALIGEPLATKRQTQENLERRAKASVANCRMCIQLLVAKFEMLTVGPLPSSSSLAALPFSLVDRMF